MKESVKCSHPARLRGRDGVLRCLSCGAVIVATAAREPPEAPPTVSVSGRKIGFDAEPKPPKRTRKRPSSDPA